MATFTIEDIVAGISESLNKLQESNISKIDKSYTMVENPVVSERESKYNSEYFDKIADDYIEFTYRNPTIFHVVQHFKDQLKKNGFNYISESKPWSEIEPGKYFTTRNGSSLVAFVVGSDWSPDLGFGAIGSHIDSLTTVLKPNSTKQKVEGYELLGVAPYSGTLNNLWWDRDLGIGGRLLVKDSKGKITQHLVDSTPNPIAHIPTLAPHFGVEGGDSSNKETRAVPVIGFSQEEDPKPTEAEKKAPLYGKHPLKLLRYIAKIANVEVEAISQWDLQLYDVQKGAKGGINKDFVFAPRVDDRVCSFAALNALIDASNEKLLKNDSFSIVALYDNEEVGSLSRAGARGGLLELVVERVLASNYYNPDGEQDYLRLAYANSIILSADVNHLFNPNYPDVYLEHHRPVPNKGVCISFDPNGHMATDSIGVSLLEDLARQNNDKLQYSHIRNDSRSGGTIGPSISSKTGVRTIDLGIPQLSMHSIRATLGAKDIGLGTKFFAGFFKNWRSTYDNYIDL
ncbi:hypothetical protein KGF56_001061 [Candida oxycetoniae]|uniref:Vacuolar aminopeptidase 1 n=1 Tax=Candida oxycetoniae TaxID=497107 RepID=A0AAI9WZM4_9ASCO|nr:uncharacterized protein KGF56_001061 [Candida oxycetoniae]KAI3406219.2 hypothetical protein KGF56_001061 [Candida oxycetoniae]